LELRPGWINCVGNNNNDDEDDDDVGRGDDEDDDDELDGDGSDGESGFVVGSIKDIDVSVSVSGKNEYDRLLLLSMYIEVTFSKKSLQLSLWYRDLTEWIDE